VGQILLRQLVRLVSLLQFEGVREQKTEENIESRRQEVTGGGGVEKYISKGD
jgi:hypothetical protein